MKTVNETKKELHMRDRACQTFINSIKAFSVNQWFSASLDYVNPARFEAQKSAWFALWDSGRSTDGDYCQHQKDLVECWELAKDAAAKGHTSQYVSWGSVSYTLLAIMVADLISKETYEILTDERRIAGAEVPLWEVLQGSKGEGDLVNAGWYGPNTAAFLDYLDTLDDLTNEQWDAARQATRHSIRFNSSYIFAKRAAECGGRRDAWVKKAGEEAWRDLGGLHGVDTRDAAQAIVVADLIEKSDYDTLTEPMRSAGATIASWEDLQAVPQ